VPKTPCLGTGSWSTLAPATILRHEGGMATVSAKNYLIGGAESGLVTTEVYDPATNTWTTGRRYPRSASTSSR
jgi:hypothetical protein